ncbi:MAG: YggS family pyridoxal phosphate-dependent enzyme [Dehalococcoidales bacterium]|nr:YggS family pyridoxal phosphate-dependent enzyme [Dehalococcoidales bacterium]
MSIRENVSQILSELPPGVALVAAAKTREAGEILEAVAAGVSIVGENYIQEAERAYQIIGKRARWHFIGHLQKNKVKKAVALFDMIETVDSLELAGEISKRCAQIGKTMPVLIEINSAREGQKWGVFPEDAAELIAEISKLPNLEVVGLMTMGPFLGDPEALRPYFRETKRLFDEIKGLKLAGVSLKYLSMGMTDSYQVAIEEGANLVRIGTKIFGERR